MSEPHCHYCAKDDSMHQIGVPIASLSVSELYLFREQSHPGRMIVAYNGHVGDITDLTDEERNAFFADVARASRALQAVYKPHKVNYGAYGDKMKHLHFHLVPKYRDGFEWGVTFAMNPGQMILTDEQCAAETAKIRAAL